MRLSAGVKRGSSSPPTRVTGAPFTTGSQLCYRRGKRGSGTWSARPRLSDGTYALRRLGRADDYAPANGANVLTFGQAQRSAIALHDKAKRDEGILTEPVTVAGAAERDLAWFRSHRESVHATGHAIRAHILPAPGHRRIASLKAHELPERPAFAQALDRLVLKSYSTSG